jgi:hypothetical protein
LFGLAQMHVTVRGGSYALPGVDGQDRPVSFMSHSFSAFERRHSTFEQEAPFAVMGLEKQ